MPTTKLSRRQALRSWGELCDSRGSLGPREHAAVARLCREMAEWLGSRSAAAVPPPSRTTLVAPLRCRCDEARFFGSTALQLIACLAPSQRPAVLEIFGSVSIDAAESILTYLGPPAPAGFLSEAAALAVSHRSERVRRKGVERAYWWNLPDFDELTRPLLDSAGHGRVARVVERYAELRRKGFHAEFVPMSWSWEVWYRHGAEMHLTEVPKIVVDTIGVAAAVARIKAAYRSGRDFVDWDAAMKGG